MRTEDSIIEIPINPGLLIANHSQFWMSTIRSSFVDCNGKPTLV